MPHSRRKENPSHVGAVAAVRQAHSCTACSPTSYGSGVRAGLLPSMSANTDPLQEELPLESPRGSSGGISVAADAINTAASPSQVPEIRAEKTAAEDGKSVTRLERIPSVTSRNVARPSLKTAFLRPDLRASRPHVLIAKSAALTVKPEPPTATAAPAIAQQSPPSVQPATGTSSPLSGSPSASRTELAVLANQEAKSDVAEVIEFKPLPDSKSWVELLRQTAKRKQHNNEEKGAESPAKPILVVDPVAKVRHHTVLVDAGSVDAKMHCRSGGPR